MIDFLKKKNATGVASSSSSSSSSSTVLPPQLQSKVNNGGSCAKDGVVKDNLNANVDRNRLGNGKNGFGNLNQNKGNN